MASAAATATSVSGFDFSSDFFGSTAAAMAFVISVFASDSGFDSNFGSEIS